MPPHYRGALMSPAPSFDAHASHVFSNYGGDGQGLICGYAFGGDATARTAEVSSEQAAQWLASRSSPGDPTGTPQGPADGYLWLHFNLANGQAVKWMERHAGLPAEFFEALGDPQAASTRIERADDFLVALVNDVHFDFGFESSDIATLWICVGPRIVVTARTRPLRSVDALRMAVRQGEAPATSTAMLEHLLRTQADVLVKVVRGVTSRVDEVEDELLKAKPDHRRARLGELRRLLVRLQRLLAPEPAALFRLLQRPPGWMAAGDVEDLRGASEEFSTVLRDMHGLQERIKLLQEEVAARVNEDNNRSLFVLTVVTVLALPINILAGLLGMNVGGIPFAQNPDGFWIVAATVATFTVVAAWLAFWRKR
ncbi:MAG: Zinc transport protein ZntB [Paracidovorax wautersii]|uniref:Zinc transport protein ZntB n=1 Tax=Paracidovorax wautersii TaxID=1177982 RepID=A0A7V8FN70_9BURK|nr:MAG: Zinc transport protein ZntB [Paracidovorax wautersii]